MSRMTYTELMQLKTFDERIEYLRLRGDVGKETFGSQRFMNQEFYHSREWKRLRNEIIVRDFGCDLGCRDREIDDVIFVHHINPVTPEEIEEGADCVWDPENLICCTKATHDYIHYGKVTRQPTMVIREPNDQSPWRKVRRI